MKRATMELLAPAGGPEQLQAAIRFGADAVYLGLGVYNARMNADNFTEEDLSEDNLSPVSNAICFTADIVSETFNFTCDTAFFGITCS